MTREVGHSRQDVVFPKPEAGQRKHYLDMGGDQNGMGHDKWRRLIFCEYGLLRCYASVLAMPHQAITSPTRQASCVVVLDTLRCILQSKRENNAVKYGFLWHSPVEAPVVDSPGQIDKGPRHKRKFNRSDIIVTEVMFIPKL